MTRSPSNHERSKPHTGIRKKAIAHSMTNPLLVTQFLIKPWSLLLFFACSITSTHAALPDHPRLLFPESAEASLQQCINIQEKAVTLIQSGKKLTIIRNDSHGGEWTVLDAQPKLDIEHQNKGVQTLAFTAPATKDLELSITFKRP